MRVGLKCSYHKKEMEIRQVLTTNMVVIIFQYWVSQINMYTLNLHNVNIQLCLSIAGKNN